MAASCERSPPPVAGSISTQSRRSRRVHQASLRSRGPPASHGPTRRAGAGHRLAGVAWRLATRAVLVAARGPGRAPRARSRGRGPARSRTAPSGSRDGPSPRGPRGPRRANRGSARTSTGGAKCSSRLDEPAGSADGRRHVDPTVDERRDDLGVDLGLGVAAHRPGHDPRPAVARNSIPGSSVWSVRLPRRQDVRVSRIEAEDTSRGSGSGSRSRDRRRRTRTPCSSTRSG